MFISSNSKKLFAPLYIEILNQPIAWPLLDEYIPPTKDLQSEKLKQAIQLSKLPESLKERFLNAIQNKLSKGSDKLPVPNDKNPLDDEGK